MKKVFITGANGLLGTNVIQELLKQEFQVFGLIRNKTKYEGENHNNLTLLEGDLFQDFSKILENVDVIIHTAAITNQNLVDYLPYWKINYDATIQLFQAAIKCNVQKFIYVSTANTIGNGTLKNLGVETNTIKPLFYKSHYAKSKFETEDYLLKYKDKINTSIVNPTFMIGAYDAKPSSGRIVQLGMKKIVFYPPGGKNVVHVKDVANGIVKSIDKSKNGEKYLLCNENLTFQEIFRKINSITNKNSILIKIPKSIMYAFGYAGDVLRLFNISTGMSSVNMKILCLNNFYSNKKSVNELKLKYAPINNAINDAIEYFKIKKM